MQMLSTTKSAFIFALVLALTAGFHCGDEKAEAGDSDQSGYTISLDTLSCGTIELDPNLENYQGGAEVTATAIPADECEFAGWTGDLSGTENPATITMDGNKTIGATFNAVNTYTLTIKATSCGSISVSPEQTSYQEGTTITATASANEGCEFLNWTNALSGSNANQTITISQNTTIGASFEPKPTIAVNLDSDSGEPWAMEVHNGKLYFSYYTAAAGSELYSFDGSNATMVTDQISGSDGFSPQSLLSHSNGNLYIAGQDASADKELYVYDGSTIALVKDLNTSGSSRHYNLTEFNSPDGNVLVSTCRPFGTSSSRRLCFYNPTVGIKMGYIDVDGVDFNFDEAPDEYTVFNGLLYFVATDPDTGTELYSWDGDPVSSPVLVNEFTPTASESSDPQGLFVANNKLYLFASTDNGSSYGMYSIDTSGTISEVGDSSIEILYPDSIVKYSGKVYGFDNANSTKFLEFDPTTETMSVVMDSFPSADGAYPYPGKVFNGKIYYVASHDNFSVSDPVIGNWIAYGLVSIDPVTGDVVAHAEGGGGSEAMAIFGDRFYWVGDIEPLDPANGWPGNEYELFFIGR